MSHRITFGLDDDNFALATAYASDRGLEVYQVARAMLLSEVKRHALRSGLLGEIESIVYRILEGQPRTPSPRGLGETAAIPAGDEIPGKTATEESHG